MNTQRFNFFLLFLFIALGSLSAARPVYIFAHRANDLDDIQDAINNGANAIEFDLRICNNQWIVNHDGCFTSTTADQWIDAFNRASNRNKIAAIAFDIKADPSEVSETKMMNLVASVRNKLPANILIIYGVGAWAKRDILSHVQDNLRANEVVSIDMSNGASAQEKIDFFKEAGVNNQVYADGFAAALATPGSVWTNLKTAVANRDNANDVKFVYSWTYESESAIKRVLIDEKCDGVLVNDCSIFCFDQLSFDDGLENALDVLRKNPSEIRLATRADLPTWGLTQNNIALGKSARSSSTRAAGGAASRAVDGNTDGHFFRSNSVSHTDGTDNRAWIEIDLGTIYDISEILLWNRTDCCAERLDNFFISTSEFSQIRDNGDGRGEDFTPDPVPFQDINPMVFKAQQPTQAQYIQVVKFGQEFGTSAGILSLAEIEVLSTPNIARGKSVSSSTTRAAGGAASRAVDGNTDGNFFRSNSVSHTNLESNPWLEVDLGESYDISLIRLWNRTDCCIDRLSGVEIWISDEPIEDNRSNAREFSLKTLGGFTSHLNPNPFSGPPQKARFVQVRLPGSNRILSLAELEIFGLPSS